MIKTFVKINSGHPVEEKENGISFFPSDYKNARSYRAWRFFVYKTNGNDCVLKALNRLKPSSFMRSDYHQLE